MKSQKDADITNYSTLRVKAKADELALPKSIEELTQILDEIKEKKLKANILGAGSNLLLSSRRIEGIVICTVGLDFITKISDTEFEVGSGVKMPRFCANMAKESLTGAEFMEGIPGTIGGGIVMNAGAHGSEMAKILISAKVFNTETWEIEELSNKDLGFIYRRSAIDPGKHTVVSAKFKFQKTEKESIRKTISEYNSARSNHQPIKAWTCGCVFKNPEGHTAGKLIDELGLKGMSEGSVKVSEKHGNFFENLNGASSIDFCKLISKVQDIVYEKKGVILHPEVKRMGIFTEEEDLIWDPDKKFATNKL